MQVRFRLTHRQVITQGLIVLFAWTCMALLNVRIGGANPILLAAYGLAFALSVGLSGRWRGAELTAEGVIIRRNRKRFVPWTDVTDVREGSVLLTRIIVFETPLRPAAFVGPRRQPARTRPRLRIEAGLHPPVVVERPGGLDRRSGVVARRQQHGLGHPRRHRRAEKR